MSHVESQLTDQEPTTAFRTDGVERVIEVEAHHPVRTAAYEVQAGSGGSPGAVWRTLQM